MPATALMNIMINAARKAGRSLTRDFGEVENLQVSVKGPGNFVSAADLKAEEIIHRELEKARPGYGFLMEERGAVAGVDNSHRWIVDPLDGTTNYLTGCPHWSVAIGCGDEDGLLAGVVYDPIRGELFRASRGGGAWLDGRRLAVRATADPAAAVLTTGFSYDAAQRIRHATAVSQLIGRIRDVRRLGSAALDLAWVAAGRLDGYFEGASGGLDSASGVLLVREAGGTVSHYEGFRGDLRRSSRRLRRCTRRSSRSCARSERSVNAPGRHRSIRCRPAKARPPRGRGDGPGSPARSRPGPAPRRPRRGGCPARR